MNKRGGVVNRETMLVGMGFVVAAIAIFGLLGSAKEVLDRDALYKDYMAKDLALILDSVYAAPGEVTYSYKIDPKHTFYVDVSEGLVKVSNEPNFRPDKTFSYRFAYDKNIVFEFKSDVIKLPDKKDLLITPMKVEITKTSAPAKVSVEFGVA